MLRDVAAVTATLLVAACGAGWHQPAPVPLGALPARQQVQVWRAGNPVRWHAVRISADSVSGIPFLQPVTCDTCRTQVPRASVDSLRLGNPVAGFWKTIGLISGAFVVAGVIYCSRGCYPD
jgi:hypothetical protein